MSNYSYMIAESSFFRRREEKGTKEFVKDTGLELDIDGGFSVPTFRSIENGLIEFGLSFEIKKLSKAAFEFVVSNLENEKFQIDFKCNSKDDELVLIEIVNGSNQDLVINFFRFMKKYHGQFLYYCDSGLMSLISDGKDNDQILEEMQIRRLE